MLMLSSQITPTKHVTFNKGEHVAHLEPPIEDTEQISEDSGSLAAHTITQKR